MSRQPIDRVPRDDVLEPKNPYRRLLRRLTVGQVKLERWVNELVSYEQNPFYFHGALPTFVFWMLILTGIGLLFYFKPTLAQSYESMEYLHRVPFGTAIRSSHRYAADAMLLAVWLHIIRVYVTDRHREYRLVPWLTGVALLALTYLAGISGYVLVGDERSWGLFEHIRQAVAVVPVCGPWLERQIIAGGEISDYTIVRFMFFHLFAAMLIFWFLWMHLIRIRRPFLLVTIGIGAAVIGLILMVDGLFPAHSYGAVANVHVPPESYRIGNWLYLPSFLLLGLGKTGAYVFWLVAAALFCGLLIVPYALRDTRRNIAHVVRDKCVGCQLCAVDCPYAAIQMVPVWNDKRKKPDLLAVVYPPRCSECGVCVGSCDFDAIELGSMPYAGIEQVVRDLAPQRTEPSPTAEAAGD